MSSLVLRRHASTTRTPGIDEDLGHVHDREVGPGEVHNLPVVGMAGVVSDVQAGETVGKWVVDVIEVGKVRGAHRDERTGEALPGLRRRDGALLKRLQEDVLRAERQLPDLVHEEEAAVRLEELSGLEDERAHRVADLLELPQVDVARQVVGEHLRAPLEPGEPEPFAQEDELGGDLRRVDRARVEAGRVTPGGEPAGTDRAGREPRDGRAVDE